MAVLGAKLHLPSPRHRLVARARITDQLRVGGGERPRPALVAAPAGFGKTTLLAQWLAANGSQCRVA
jgi:LuxR family maltose regulon positive regulatory protein